MSVRTTSPRVSAPPPPGIPASLLFFLALLAFFAGSPSPAGAQSGSITFLTTRDGLAGNLVTAIAFEANGNAWVGTTAGATHVEDNRWTVYTREHGLGSAWINAIALAPDGRAWFATNGGLSVFDGKQFVTYALSGTQGLPSNFVTSLAIDPVGAVWAGTLDAGVARFEPEANRWTRYSLPTNNITALAIDAGGTPWAGTDGGGLFRFDGRTWQRVGSLKAGDPLGQTGGPAGRLGPPTDAAVRALWVEGGELLVRTRETFFAYDGTNWRNRRDPALEVADRLGLRAGEVRVYATDRTGRLWAGTARGVVLSGPLPPEMRLPAPLPVVLVHGWTGPESDLLRDSEFRFLQQYAERDGITVSFAQGIRPENTLYQNAANLATEIARVRQQTGAAQVNVIAFSMGGLNTRALLETSLYRGDVHRAIILGTPQAGVDIWYPVLVQQILTKPDRPSAIELTPEYARLWNASHAPRPSVPYDLLTGDVARQADLPILRDLPPSDGLIGAWSALALQAPNVRRAVDGDLHAFEPIAVPYDLGSYLYPDRTYRRYLRNALRDPAARPLGTEVQVSQTLTYTQPAPRNHTPLETTTLAAGQTVTRTLVLDANDRTRFLAYFPGGEVDFTLTGPDGKPYEGDTLPVGETNGAFRLQADIASFVGYSVDKAAPGRWLLTLKRTDKGSAPLDVLTYADLDSSLRLAVSTDPDRQPPEQLYHPGDAVLLRATVSSVSAARGVTVRAQISDPGRAAGTLDLYDDGAHGDGAAGDGVFAGRLRVSRPGYYVIRVQARGAALERETEMVLPVASEAARLTGAEATRTDGGLLVQARVAVATAGLFAVSVTLRGAEDAVVARLSSPSVSLSAGNASVPVLVPDADLKARGIGGPYRVDLVLMDTREAAYALDAQQNITTTPAYNVGP